VAPLAEPINNRALGNVVGFASATHPLRGVLDSSRAGRLAEPREGDGFAVASVAISLA